jgi:hypothetical protein
LKHRNIEAACADVSADRSWMSPGDVSVTSLTTSLHDLAAGGASELAVEVGSAVGSPVAIAVGVELGSAVGDQAGSDGGAVVAAGVVPDGVVRNCGSLGW